VSCVYFLLGHLMLHLHHLSSASLTYAAISFLCDEVYEDEVARGGGPPRAAKYRGVAATNPDNEGEEEEDPSLSYAPAVREVTSF